MKQQKVKVSQKEKDLIETIRNYRSGYPNGNEELRFYINQLVAELMDNDD